MAPHYHRLKVAEIRKETPECISILFEVPEMLREKFRFKQGQNVTVKTHLDDVRRSYSICSSPAERDLRIAVKKVPNGVFSTYATEQLKKGDFLELLPPTGTFYTEVDSAQKKKYLFFAAGSGITPVISIIKTILYTEEDSHITLVYGNRNVHSIIFKEQLEALKDKFLLRFRIMYILSRERTDADLNYGRIDAEKCQQLSPLISYQSMDETFICGPEKMIFTVKDFLIAQGVHTSKIHFELFTTPASPAYTPQIKKEEIPETGSAITVTIDGRSYDFPLEYDSNTILDAGLNEGLDLPYACKGGVCSTCRARLLEGKVEMEVCYGLEDDEVADGYILTCQSHPRSEKVVVDYDQ